MLENKIKTISPDFSFSSTRLDFSNKAHPASLAGVVRNLLEKIRQNLKDPYRHLREKHARLEKLQKEHDEADEAVRRNLRPPSMPVSDVSIPLQPAYECMQPAYQVGRLIERIEWLVDHGEDVLEGRRWAELRSWRKEREHTLDDAMSMMEHLLREGGYDPSSAARKVKEKYGGKASSHRSKWYRYRRRS